MDEKVKVAFVIMLLNACFLIAHMADLVALPKPFGVGLISSLFVAAYLIGCIDTRTETATDTNI